MMSARTEARRVILGTIERLTRMEERAKAVEADLLRLAEAGSKHPDLARALAESRTAVNDCESLLSRSAALAVECEQLAGGCIPN